MISTNTYTRLHCSVYQTIVGTQVDVLKYTPVVFKAIFIPLVALRPLQNYVSFIKIIVVEEFGCSSYHDANIFLTFTKRETLLGFKFLPSSPCILPFQKCNRMKSLLLRNNTFHIQQFDPYIS